jgi:NAD(P)-dependent dehydrogenase (short-subunit alcohol dehydrogenase family)
VLQDGIAGRTAFITGAARGIGLGIARALAREGANIALADLQEDRLAAARAEVEALGVRVATYPLDVTDRAAVYRAADAVERDFGKVHVLVNNAGIGYSGTPIHEVPDQDIDWVFGVNTFGMMNGVKAFVPKIIAHGEGGYLLNTASIAGLHVMPGWHQGLYAASKMATVALSEGLRESLAPHNITVSVLCPAAANTEIYKSFMAGNLRPDRFGPSSERTLRPERLAELEVGLSPDEIGAITIEAMKKGVFFIFTHPESKAYVDRRNVRIMSDFALAPSYIARAKLARARGSAS